jgi:nucleoside triphosphate diphosphatase
VVFHSQMAAEAGHFAFDDVATAISDKMIRRHPHVFAQADIRSISEQTAAWEDQKAQERQSQGHESVLDGVASALPAMLRAIKLQKRAARVGFDWPDAHQVMLKIDEEIQEVKVELQQNSGHDRLEDEIGDLLFVTINLARKLDIDPEQALKRANGKFDCRFRFIEDSLNSQGRSLEQTSLDEMEALWCDAKKTERK